MIKPIRPLLLQLAAALWFIAFVTAPIAVAQEGKEDTAADEATDTVLTMIQNSGWSGLAFMAILGVFSLLAATVVIERLVNLTRGKIIPALFTLQLQQLVSKEEHSPGEFRKLTEQFASPIANVLRSALLRVGRPIPEVEKAMEDSLGREVDALRSSIRPLSVIGKVAPLVGLLGTVVGMIMAFHTASQEGLGGKAEILAEGIYLALMTTAAGLTIAIPALLFAAFFNSRIDKLMRQMDEQLMETIPCFVLMEADTPGRKHVTEELVGAMD